MSDYDPSDKQILEELTNVLNTTSELDLLIDRKLLQKTIDKINKLVKDRDEWKRSFFDNTQSIYD